MERHTCTPRPDWQARVEGQGMAYHTIDEQPYWDESAFYQFRSSEIDEIEKATYALNELCLKAAEQIFKQDRLAQFNIPPPFHDWLRQSWDRDELTVYGRFDFCYDGRSPPKLLEYNADTPTALLEAAVIQWFWMKDAHPDADQFNSIHEKLLELWPGLGPTTQGPIHFASQRGQVEDLMTVTYLRDTAQQAGLDTVYLAVEEIGWNAARRAFVDMQERPLRTAFKLYPWEWMLREEFGQRLLEYRMRWLEPPWKMLLSNKSILVLLWELFPECPYLLPTYFQPKTDSYVKKPCQGREGANVLYMLNGQSLQETDGPYSDGPFVYQEARSLPEFDGNYPVIGSWLVNGYACGMGIREDRTPITSNTSRFVPHLFVP
ncbi:MAG TPA: glutathionylspermidine synthase family protein [Gemmataceae bacterium]|nr:glutathionylspermidine synthase family protein [Gemmataceae bacterium]